MSGFSKMEARGIIKAAIEPPLRKVVCALEAVETASGGGATTVNYTPITTSTSTSGSTTAGRYSISVSNIGGSAGIFNGTSLPAGASISYTAYKDPLTNVFNRVGSVSYDATGTTFLISETP